MNDSFELIGQAKFNVFTSSDFINARTELGKQTLKTVYQTIIDKKLTEEKDAKPFVNDLDDFMRETLFLCGRVNAIPCIVPVDIGSRYSFKTKHVAFITIKDGIVTDISSEDPQLSVQDSHQDSQ